MIVMSIFALELAAAVLLPSALSLFYYAHVLLEMIFWASNQKIPYTRSWCVLSIPAHVRFRNGLLFYVCGHLIASFALQIPLLHEESNQAALNLLGLMKLDAENVPSIIAFCCCICILVLINWHGQNSRTYRLNHGRFVSFANDLGVSKAFAQRRRTRTEESRSLRLRTYDFVVRNAPKVCTVYDLH
jgi:hypothetical protein